MDEFHGHLNAQATKFSERVFAILDQDMSGLLSLREFIVGIWNYCTYDATLVSKVRCGRRCRATTIAFAKLPPTVSLAEWEAYSLPSFA